MEKTVIMHSRYFNRTTSGEHFIPEHTFSYQEAGSLIINDGNKQIICREGDFRFSRRNQLARFVKISPENGEFSSVSVSLDQDSLRDFSREYGYTADTIPHYNETIIALRPNPLFRHYIDSLTPYFNLTGVEDQPLLALKLKEAVLILLKTNPAIKNALFDFSEPGKIGLETFMNRNFQFNVSMQRFAYLTGRSLPTFKRDFEKIFHISPGRWLLQKRLRQAYFLIKEKSKKPSDVYLEVGFEDLSHFSYAFKKEYGMAPSQLSP